MPARSAYGTKPFNYPHLDAEGRGWGRGWPKPTVKIVSATGAGITVPVNKGIKELVELLLAESYRRGYRPHKGWCWGYCNRAIAGTHTASNHSWGLAIDLDSPTNPYSHTFSSTLPAWLPRLWAAYGFFWGGWYANKIDTMHVEYVGTPAQATKDTVRARANFNGKSTAPAPVAPVPRANPRVEPVRMVKGKAVLDHGSVVRLFAAYKTNTSPTAAGKVVQLALNSALGGHLRVDGVIGPASRAAYAAWQRKCGSTAKGANGVPGPGTLTKLGIVSGLFTVGN